LKTPNNKLFLAGGYASGLTAKCITMEGISVRQLSSTQLEADTCMLLYAIDFDRRMSSKNVTGRLVVQSPDTDVMILLILYMQQMEAVQDLWMETGTITRTLDLRRLIPIHKIADKVGPVVCNTLPAVHALTGCDTVSHSLALVRRRCGSWQWNYPHRSYPDLLTWAGMTLQRQQMLLKDS